MMKRMLRRIRCGFHYHLYDETAYTTRFSNKERFHVTELRCRICGKKVHIDSRSK